jgi:UDP-glucuronate 4-epimerase
MKILVTGCAGFIGMHLSKKLLEAGYDVIGIDNLNDYYLVSLKESRLKKLFFHSNFDFHNIDISCRKDMSNFFSKNRVNVIFHLAAQPGVRFSVDCPQAYVDNNLVGFANILEGAKTSNVGHFVFASSSSVYGSNEKIPFSEDDVVDQPLSFYAATKKANELMAFSYSSLFQIPTTGLRFFTVYGPWGRPDMSPFLFTKAIFNNEPIKIFNHGNMMRDFTYIDDVIEAIMRIFNKPPSFTNSVNNSSSKYAPFQLLNIGNNSPVQLLNYINELELAIGKTTKKLLLPMQLGDVPKTMADTDKLEALIGFKPQTSLRCGIKKFISWYKDYYGGT